MTSRISSCVSGRSATSVEFRSESATAEKLAEVVPAGGMIDVETNPEPSCKLLHVKISKLHRHMHFIEYARSCDSPVLRSERELGEIDSPSLTHPSNIPLHKLVRRITHEITSFTFDAWFIG